MPTKLFYFSFVSELRRWWNIARSCHKNGWSTHSKASTNWEVAGFKRRHGRSMTNWRDSEQFKEWD